MGDVEAALAFVARRTGKPAMPATEWVHWLSLELGWMPPAQAKAFVARGLEGGVLAEAEGLVRLAFAAESVELPRGFRPDPQAAVAAASVAAGAAGGDTFVGWLDRLARHKGVARDAVLAEVAARQQSMGGLLSAWAALLWLAADAGLDVRQAAKTSG